MAAVEVGPSETLHSFLRDRIAAQGKIREPERELSYHDLFKRSGSAAAALKRMGVQRGDRVALWMPNSAGWLACFFACAQIGAIALCINTRFRATELADVIRRAGPKVLVFWPGFPEVDFGHILGTVPADDLVSIEHIVAYSDSSDSATNSPFAGWSALSWRDFISEAPMDEAEGDADAACAIFTTSGTTKAPKFVLHSQRNLVRHAANAARGLRMNEHSVAYLPVPLCGILGTCCVMASLSVGGSVIVPTGWNPDAAAADFTRFGVTHANVPDVMLEQLLVRKQEPIAYPAFVYGLYGAFDPALRDIGQRAEDRGMVFATPYGSSELQALLTVSPIGASREQRFTPGGTLVAPTGRVRAVDIETRRELPHGEAGELEFLVPDSVMLGYFADPKATAEAFTADGYFRSGDVGHTTGLSSFVYTARKNDTLRLSGFIVNPLEIEAAILAHPALDRCQVVGVYQGREAVAVAFVVPKKGAASTERDIIEHLSGAVAKYKIPRRVLFVERFPTADGVNGEKIQKQRLREIAVAALNETSSGNVAS